MFGQKQQNDSNFGYEDKDQYRFDNSTHKNNFLSDGGTNQDSNSGPIFGENPAYNTNFGLDLTTQYGGGFLTSQTTAAASNQTTLGSHTFLPMKISMINRAWKDNSMENNFSILGLPIEHIKLVGHVVCVQKQGDNKYVIDLDDGTGLITCDYLVADSPSPYRQNQLNELLSKPDVYVKVYGAINTLGKRTPHIRAHIIRLINHPNEIALHDLEVCYIASKRSTYLSELEDLTQAFQNEAKPHTYGEYAHSLPNDPKSHTRGEYEQFNNDGYGAHTHTRDPYQNHPRNPNHGYAMHQNDTQFSEGPNKQLMKVVEDILSETSARNNPQGLHISEIMRRCSYSQPNVSERAVRRALYDLEREAIIYNTINSDTFHISHS